jgi:GntR family transcriptional regulator, transcriptional repressor for pyruvate dehydrogenase complex
MSSRTEKVTPLDRPVPRAQGVATALRTLVHEQRLVPGDKLPSESELIEMLQVSRSSVREGVQLLESLGIVEVEQGRGTFLASAVGGGLRRVIDWAYAPEDRAQLIHDLTEARLLVEPEQARLAAKWATDEELAELKRIAAVHRDAGDAEDTGLDYHLYLARLAHNDVLLFVSNGLRSLYQSLIKGIDRPSSEIVHALDAHAGITRAIEQRNGEEAAELMRQHLRENRDVLAKYL